MKILAVKIQNLASLRGTFEVNFQEFFDFGNVVLIHGPTGAGKTTILDAISLAIFGQTAQFWKQYSRTHYDNRRGILYCFRIGRYSKNSFHEWFGNGNIREQTPPNL